MLDSTYFVRIKKMKAGMGWSRSNLPRVIGKQPFGPAHPIVFSYRPDPPYINMKATDDNNTFGHPTKMLNGASQQSVSTG